MNYHKITTEDVTFFQEILDIQRVIQDEDILFLQGKDETEKLQNTPELALEPQSTEEVSEILKYCFQKNIPLTTRGGGTGLAGGAIPIEGGVVLNMKRMNKIIHIDTENFQTQVEAGVINFHLQEKLAEFGLFFPPDPSSWGSSFIGGNISTNAGGPKAVKYGVTAQHVLNLEVVLPNGDIIWTGANTLKNSTGYNLTQLFTGSEGTLGVITQAVLKIAKKPEKDVVLLVPFLKVEAACKAVSDIFMAGIEPSVMEMMEQEALRITAEHLEIPITQEVEAQLLIVLEGFDEEIIMQQAEKCMEVLERFEIGEIAFADNDTDKARLWQMRRKVAEIVKANGYTIEEDTVVPRAKMGELVHFVHEWSEKHQMKAVCYGHAGDGNLHVRVNHPTYKNSYGEEKMQLIIHELFEEVHRLGGTISGEHGVGLIQKRYLPIFYNEAQLNLQKHIKQTIDPKNIMNPNKVIYG